MPICRPVQKSVRLKTSLPSSKNLAESLTCLVLRSFFFKLPRKKFFFYSLDIGIRLLVGFFPAEFVYLINHLLIAVG